MELLEYDRKCEVEEEEATCNDNEYEIKAEKYAQRNGKKWLRKLLDHIPDG